MRLLRTQKLLIATASVLCLGTGIACSSDSDEGDGDFSSGDGDTASGGSTGIDLGNGAATGGAFMGFGGDGSGEEELPEEIEDDSSYRAPVTTGRYLWSANPLSGRVALIDALDLSVRVLPAGLFPTFLTAVPESDDAPQALVINTGSSDVTRFTVSGEEVLRDSQKTHVGANRWATSPNWAVVYSVKEPGQKLDPTDGLQEITVLALEEDQMRDTRLTVGYRPSQLVISEDEQRLIVVSDEGITLVELSDDPHPVDWIDLGFEAEKRDVSITRDGKYALVRRTDEKDVEIYDLKNPQNVVTLSFSGPVTDADLSESGRAVVVVRAKSEVFTFDLTEVLSDPSKVYSQVLTNQLFGSAMVTSGGETAVLYTNAVANEVVNVVDLRAGGSFLSYRQVSTQAPVYSVTSTPDGKHAVVLAGDAAGNKAQAFSVVALYEARFPRVVGTGASVDQVSLGDAFGVVTANNPLLNVHQAHLIEFPGLQVSTRKLASTPLSTGVLNDLNQAFVAQQHPEGRVTFFDLKADQARTLTGFELSAEVVDE